MAIPMPGMAVQGLDISKTIEKLVAVKKEPLKQIESEIDKLNLEKEVWAGLRQRLSSLGDLSRRMYDYTNPFGVLLAESSDSDSFTATAERKAKKAQRKIQVLQTASSHRIASDSLKKEKILPGGIFYIELGKKKTRVDFSLGGTLSDLASRLELVASDLVNPVLTHDTSETSILVLEANEGGDGNRLSFSGELEALKVAGILSEGGTETLRLDLGSAEWALLGGKEDAYRQREGILELGAGVKLKHSLPQGLASDQGWSLSFSLSYETNRSDASAGERESGAKDLLLGPDDPLEIEDLLIHGPRLEPGLEGLVGREESQDSPETSTGETGFVRLLGSGQEFVLPLRLEAEDWQEFEFRLGELDDLTSVNELILLNENRDSRLRVKDLVFRRAGESGLSVKNNLVDPRDAVVMIDGVRITRADNTIDDAIEGVSLALRRPGAESQLEIKHDVELITSYIIEWVEGYNQTLNFLNAVTRHLSKEERKKLEEEQKNKTDLVRALEDANKIDEERFQGLLPGDMAISRLKSNLANIIMSPYKTRLERELALLMQVGISTGKAGSNWADIKNSAGMLEIDTTILKKMIEKDIIAVSQIFGNDLNSDFVIDHGVCLSLYELTRNWIQAGNSGVIAVKLQSLERVLSEKRKTFDRVELSVKSYEDRLRNQFSSMETKVRDYQERGRWLNRQDQ